MKSMPTMIETTGNLRLNKTVSGVRPVIELPVSLLKVGVPITAQQFVKILICKTVVESDHKSELINIAIEKEYIDASPVNDYDNRGDRILSYIKANPFATPLQVAEALNLTEVFVRLNLGKCMKSNEIRYIVRNIHRQKVRLYFAPTSNGIAEDTNANNNKWYAEDQNVIGLSQSIDN